MRSIRQGPVFKVVRSHPHHTAARERWKERRERLPSPRNDETESKLASQDEREYAEAREPSAEAAPVHCQVEGSNSCMPNRFSQRQQQSSNGRPTV